MPSGIIRLAALFIVILQTYIISDFSRHFSSMTFSIKKKAVTVENDGRVPFAFHARLRNEALHVRKLHRPGKGMHMHADTNSEVHGKDFWTSFGSN
jgi:hypothetical protein